MCPLFFKPHPQKRTYNSTPHMLPLRKSICSVLYLIRIIASYQRKIFTKSDAMEIRILVPLTQ